MNVQLKVELKIGQERKPADLQRLIKLLKQANYQGYVVLEYEAAEDPYTAIPPLLSKPEHQWQVAHWVDAGVIGKMRLQCASHSCLAKPDDSR